MSRNYEVSVTVKDYNPDNNDAICDAMDEEGCDNHDVYESGPPEARVLSYGGFSMQLGGGETEDEFTRRLSRAVWKANNGPCIVETSMIDIDNAPCENNECGEDEFNEDMQQYLCPDCGSRWYHPKGDPEECASCGAMVQEIPF